MIRSGIIFVRDLTFIDGVLDCTAMYNKIEDKQNLLVELNLVRQALLPFKQALAEIDFLGMPDDSIQVPFTLIKSKSMYDNLVEYKTRVVMSMSKHVELFKKNNVTFETVCKRKLVNMREIKLKEFNYKLMFNLIPCNKNLEKWKIIDSDICDVCKDVQTTKHLLFDCSYVRILWEIMELIVGSEIFYSDILCGFDTEKSLFADYLCTICAFVIYKDFLLHSLNKRKRPFQCNLKYFENEICFRFNIYSLIGLNCN